MTTEEKKVAAQEVTLPRPAVYTYVRDVLDSQFLKYETKKSDKTENIRESFKSECNELNNDKQIGVYEHKYENPAARLAYLMLHFSPHSYIVNSVLSDAYSACTNIQSRTTVFNELMRSIDWGRISVFSFGGGPASDIFGVLMWLHRFGFNARVTAATTDPCRQWEGTTTAMFKMMQFEAAESDSKPTPQQKYTHNLWKKLDSGVKYFHSSLKNTAPFLKSGSKEVLAISQADIITLPFIVSSVAESPEAATALQHVLDNMKPGALLVYIDHREGPQTELINNLSYYRGLRRIYFMKEMSCKMPKYEDPEFLKAYTNILDEDMTRDIKATAIVYKKPSGYSYDRRMKMSKRESVNVKQAQIRLKKSNPDFKLFKPTLY